MGRRLFGTEVDLVSTQPGQVPSHQEEVAQARTRMKQVNAWLVVAVATGVAAVVRRDVGMRLRWPMGSRPRACARMFGRETGEYDDGARPVDRFRPQFDHVWNVACEYSVRGRLWSVLFSYVRAW